MLYTFLPMLFVCFYKSFPDKSAVSMKLIFRMVFVVFGLLRFLTFTPNVLLLHSPLLQTPVCLFIALLCSMSPSFSKGFHTLITIIITELFIAPVWNVENEGLPIRKWERLKQKKRLCIKISSMRSNEVLITKP